VDAIGVNDVEVAQDGEDEPAAEVEEQADDAVAVDQGAVLEVLEPVSEKGSADEAPMYVHLYLSFRGGNVVK
jgi:hypothetical protein